MRDLADFGRRFREAGLIDEDAVEKDGQFAAADEGCRVFADDRRRRGRRLQQRADGAETPEDALGIDGAEEQQIHASHDLADSFFYVTQLGVEPRHGDGVVEEHRR